MEVKVKKEVLFNLLKKALNENRTFDNPSGNFIHSFDRQEAPIQPSAHMATQLSVEEPPVADENYMPASIGELRSAASRIAEEVPPGQIEYYYRALHKLLDSAIDKSQEGMLAESGRAFSMRGMFDDSDDDGRYDDGRYDDADDTFTDSEYSLEDFEERDQSIEDNQNFKDAVEVLKNMSGRDLDEALAFYAQSLEMELPGMSASTIEVALKNELEGKKPGLEARPIATGGARSTPTALPSPKPKPTLNTSEEDKIELGDPDFEMGMEIGLLEEDITPEGIFELNQAFAAIAKDPGRKEKFLSGFRLGSTIGNIKLDSEEQKPVAASASDDRREKYWKGNLLSKGQDPVAAFAQVTFDSARDVSRLIGTDVGKNNFLGAGSSESTFSNEQQAWSGVLSNNVNFNEEVLSKAAKNRKEEKWKKTTEAFIERFLEGPGGVLQPHVSKYKRTLQGAALWFSKNFADFDGDPESAVKKIAAYIVSNTVGKISASGHGRDIERDLENISPGELLNITNFEIKSESPNAIPETAHKRTIDTLRKLDDTLGIPTQNKILISKGIDLDQDIEYFGESISLEEAFRREFIFQLFRQAKLIAPLYSNMASDPANARREIMKIFNENVKDSTDIAYSVSGSKKDAVVKKQDLNFSADMYIDLLKESGKKEDDTEEMSEEEIDDIMGKLEDPSISEDQKKLMMTDAIATRIMQTIDNSQASFRDYDYRVLSKKQKMAFDAIRKEDVDPDTLTYLTIFNDTISEIAPQAVQSIKEIEKGLTPEEVAQISKMVPALDDQEVKSIAMDVIKAAASDSVGIAAIERMVYGKDEVVELAGETDAVERPATRGGEIFMQNIAEQDLDFLLDTGAAAPSIVRNIVGSLMGKTLRGGGLSKIPDINFNRVNQSIATNAVRNAVQVEKEMLRLFKSEFGSVDMDEAQNSSFETAAELGIKETKANFLEKNMKDLQIKTIYPFVARVKTMPDFEKMNPAAKNFVCWCTAIADANHDGAATMEEKKKTAKKIFDKLLSIGDRMLGKASEDTKKFTEEIDDNLAEIMSKVKTDLEAMEEFTSKAVRSLSKNKDQMRNAIIQAVGMHIQDINMLPVKEE